MTDLEKAFPGVFDRLSPQDKAEIIESSNQAVLLQALYIGPEEYLRTAREFGYEIVEVAIKRPSSSVIHFQKIAA